MFPSLVTRRGKSFQDDTPFFTSDYPVALAVGDPSTPINRVVPLAPDLAVRIKPDIRLARAPDDLTFTMFKSARRALKRHEVVNLNRLIVQCAHHYIEPVKLKAQHGAQQAFISSQRIGVRVGKAAK
jgi:hypothetical protein